MRTCLSLVLLSCLTSSADAEFVFVDVGADLPPAPVIVFPGAPPKTREAAVELADYLEKICGRRPEVIDRTPQQIPERAIWVGYQKPFESLFPKVNFEFRHPEEVLIAATENHLVIAGRDRWHPEHLTVEGIDEKIIGRQQEYGTVNAV